MAMNKKEQAAYDELVAQARINRALRWSDYGVERDMPVPEVWGNAKTAGASTPPLALFIRHGAELRFTAHGKRERLSMQPPAACEA